MTDVLIVDDDANTCAGLAALLEARGYHVRTAADGNEALAKVGTGDIPSLVILDLVLPGMTGWQLRVELLARAELARIPVVVLSGLDDIAQHAKILSAVEYLKKPILLEKLYWILGTYLGASQARRQ